MTELATVPKQGPPPRKVAPSQGGPVSPPTSPVAFSALSTRDSVPGSTSEKSSRISGTGADASADENSRNNTIPIEREGVTSILSHRQDRNHDDARH
jgi:hypothetical protein